MLVQAGLPADKSERVAARQGGLACLMSFSTLTDVHLVASGHHTVPFTPAEAAAWLGAPAEDEDHQITTVDDEDVCLSCFDT